MIKQVCTVLITVALASSAHAGIQFSDQALAAGTTSSMVTVEYVNDTGGTITLLGAQVLNFTLDVTPYVGSGGTNPTLVSATPDVTGTSFVDFGATSPMAPLGTLVANNFVGFSIIDEGTIALGKLMIDIPSDFIGEFILKSTTGDLAASFGPLGDLDDQGDTVSGTIQVGEGVAVPEPSSFLFLGLVGTGVLGMRRFRRREEEVTEEA